MEAAQQRFSVPAADQEGGPWRPYPYLRDGGDKMLDTGRRSPFCPWFDLASEYPPLEAKVFGQFLVRSIFMMPAGVVKDMLDLWPPQSLLSYIWRWGRPADSFDYRLEEVGDTRLHRDMVEDLNQLVATDIRMWSILRLEGCRDHALASAASASRGGPTANPYGLLARWPDQPPRVSALRAEPMPAQRLDLQCVADPSPTPATMAGRLSPPLPASWPPRSYPSAGDRTFVYADWFVLVQGEEGEGDAGAFAGARWDHHDLPPAAGEAAKQSQGYSKDSRGKNITADRREGFEIEVREAGGSWPRLQQLQPSAEITFDGAAYHLFTSAPAAGKDAAQSLEGDVWSLVLVPAGREAGDDSDGSGSSRSTPDQGPPRAAFGGGGPAILRTEPASPPSQPTAAPCFHNGAPPRRPRATPGVPSTPGILAPAALVAGMRS